jgi:hypothetical protein
VPTSSHDRGVTKQTVNYFRPVLKGASNLYESVDTLREKYGKHTVFLGASFLAHQSAQHEGERGHLPDRRREPLPGETTRKRLGIPMFLGEVH